MTEVDFCEDGGCVVSGVLVVVDDFDSATAEERGIEDWGVVSTVIEGRRGAYRLVG